MPGLFDSNGSGFGSGNGFASDSGLSSIIGGIFGNSDKPYKDFAKEYEKYSNQAKDYVNPFYNAGVNAIPDYQNWANSMKDPTSFINNLMNNYQESPYARFQLQQGRRAAENAASASGLLGSTPYLQAGEDYAQNITSEDMNKWLQNVLGINTQYGTAEQNLVTGGQNAANALLQLQQALAENMGAAKYGAAAGKNKDTGGIIGGLTKFFLG